MATAQFTEAELKAYRERHKAMVEDHARVLLEMVDDMKDNPKGLKKALSGYNPDNRDYKRDAVHKVIEHMQNDPENFPAEIKAIFEDLLIVKKIEPEKTPPAKKPHKKKSFVRKLIERIQECQLSNPPKQK